MMNDDEIVMPDFNKWSEHLFSNEQIAQALEEAFNQGKYYGYRQGYNTGYEMGWSWEQDKQKSS